MGLVHAGMLLVFASLSHAAPILSEVYYDAVGTDNGYGFIEIYGEAGSDASGLVIEGINGSNGASGPVITLEGVFPADGLLVVADVDGDGETFVANADLLANFDFQNGPDSIVLLDQDVVVDAVGYGVFAAGDVFAGEGTPAPDPAAGASLARAFANVDTDDNFADFVVLDLPTPGFAPLLAVPEPNTSTMLFVSLGVLGVLRRRGGGRLR